MSAELRVLHNIGAARLVFVGFKNLRKAANDARNSPLMNVFQDLPLGGLTQQECGGLILIPMEGMAIKVEQPEEVVEVFLRETGGAPSRIQLLCSALVENLDKAGARTLTLADAEASIRLPQVQAVIRNWFRESTTPLERQLAKVISPHLPCGEQDLVRRITALAPGWPDHEIMAELDDLRISDVLTFQPDGRLNYSFPMMREVVHPATSAKAAFTDIVHELKHLLRQHRLTTHE